MPQGGGGACLILGFRKGGGVGGGLIREAGLMERGGLNRTFTVKQTSVSVCNFSIKPLKEEALDS